MRISKRITFLLLGALVTTTIGSVLAHSAAKWALGKLHPRYTSAANKPPAPVSGLLAQTSLVESVGQPPRARSDAMAQAFRSGKLPSPLPLPSGNPDDAASDLAKKIAAADEQSTAALMGAIEMAGFSILGEDGAIKFKPSAQSQGLAFDAFSVAAMAKLYSDGWALSLTDLGAVLGKAIPSFEKQDASAFLLRGISRAAEGDQPLRFWARTIVELGRQATPAYDLLDPKTDPAKVQLNAIQISFILERIAGDLWVAAKRPASPAHAEYEPPERQSQGQMQQAAFHPFRRPRLVVVDDPSPGLSSPCGENTNTVLDFLAVLKSTGWINLSGEAEPGEAVGMGRANAVLAILRFIYIYAAMNVEITIDKNPLVRTYEGPWTQDMRYNGEKGVLKTHVWFEVHNWPCVLWALMRAGLGRNELDVGNLPKNGAAEGVGISWQGLEGFAGSNEPDAQHAAIVAFDNVDRSGFEGATWNKETDENGDSTMKVTGLAQRFDMTYMKRFPIMKNMSLRVDVAFKHNGTARKMLDELLDVLGPALATAKGELLEGLTGAITETLFRMHWYSSDVQDFPVQDWMACSKGWGGTITFDRGLHTSHQSSNPGSGTTHTADDWTEHSTLTLSGGDNMLSQPYWGESNAVWSASYGRKQINESHFSAPPGQCAALISRLVKADSTITADWSGSGGGATKVRVYAGPEGQTGWQYSVQLDVGSAPLKYKVGGTCSSQTVGSDFKDVSNGRCEIVTATTGGGGKDCGFEQTIPISSVQGAVDPKHPDEIHDVQTQTDPFSGAKTQIKVDLMRCDQ